jgi:hypothetical protein
MASTASSWREAGQHVLAVRVAHRLGIPVRAAEQVLEGIGVSQAGRFGQLPTVFALDGTQKALEVRANA